MLRRVMRLESFSVQKFRSIIKAEKLAVGDLTVLVGPNNEGKSNILQALVMGMEELSSPVSSATRGVRRGRLASGYDWARDFPHSLQTDEANGKSILDFDFSLTDEEIGEFQTAVGSRLNGILPIRVQFGGTRPSFLVRKQRHSAALSAKRQEIAEFVAERVQVQYIPAVRTADVTASIVKTMVRRELASVEREPEFQAALKRVRAIQQPVLDRISAALSTRMQELLPEVSTVDIQLDDRQALSDVRVIVDDGTPTELDFKGDGVQSLAALSVIQHYASETARAKEFILAVEEPEAHLHPKAIHALRAVLRETAARQQVVLTTHSPLFVNRLHVHSNVIVERTRARPAQSVQELRAVLGVRTSDNLEHAEVILVVEGPEDARAISALLSDRSTSLSTGLSEGTLTLWPLHGGGNLNYVLTQLRDSLAAVHAFLDGDKAGETAALAAEQEGLLDPPDRTMVNLPGGTEAEFEDLVAPEAYESVFLERFGIRVAHPWINKLGKGKWSSRLPAIVKASGQVWDPTRQGAYKAAVSEAVSASPKSALKPEAEPILAALVDSLERKLAARDG